MNPEEYANDTVDHVDEQNGLFVTHENSFLILDIRRHLLEQVGGVDCLAVLLLQLIELTL